VTDDDEFTVEAARHAAERDDLATWVARFLASPGSDNAELGAGLTETPRSWHGPVRLPLDQLNRLAGPPDAPVLVALDDDDWRDDVDEMAERVEEEGWEPPPVIVTHQDGRLVLEDGNHRVEGIRRAGRDQVWAIVAFDDPDERDHFAASHPTGATDQR
jgi:hypothetical protein